jgi:hypothetical protein
LKSSELLEFHFRHAQYSLGDFRSAANTFEKGLNMDPTNASLKASLESAQARIMPDDDNLPPPMSDYSTREPRSTPGAQNAGAGAGLGGMADMLSGLGGAGGGGGMPDIASMMNNPQMMAMAQQMAANGGLANLLQNPAVANMVFHCLLSVGYDCVLIIRTRRWGGYSQVTCLRWRKLCLIPASENCALCRFFFHSFPDTSL